MTPHMSLSSVSSISGKLSLLLAGAKKYRPSRLRSIFAVTAPSTTAKTARPTRRVPVRSTAKMPPSRMPASQRQSPSARHKNVDDGCRTTHEMGSISSSRSSPVVFPKCSHFLSVRYDQSMTDSGERGVSSTNNITAFVKPKKCPKLKRIKYSSAAFLQMLHSGIA